MEKDIYEEVWRTNNKNFYDLLVSAYDYLNDICGIVFGYKVVDNKVKYIPTKLPLTADNPINKPTYEMAIYSNLVNDVIDLVELGKSNQELSYDSVDKEKYSDILNFMKLNYEEVTKNVKDKFKLKQLCNK